MKPTAAKSPQYPIGTVAAYGPNNTLATKLVVAVFKKPGRKEPDELRRWFSRVGDVRNDPAIAAEIADFLKRNGVRGTVTPDRILGCPHEEGVDYPVGAVCPHCPYWATADRSSPKPKPPSLSASIAPNDPCPCGSAKKYKECCGAWA
jgi:hypothetical protein